jgi:anti-sigma regulatory factor (Ser/Thr protein kinase)
MTRQLKFDVRDPSQIGSARRAAQDMAEKIGLDETQAGQAAIAVTELGSNFLKHAGGGELLMRPLGDATSSGIELLAIDNGPGMADIAGSMRDGFSTAGSMGMGLGALSRLATSFDVYSLPGKGTVVRVQIAAERAPAGQMEIGVVCQPKPGEQRCGDDWAFVWQQDRSMLLIADGLGHGPDAHKAAQVAIDVVNRQAARDPASVLDDIHAESRATRGAAVSICAIEHARGLCRFSGIGNVSCAVVSGGRSRSFAALPGIIGHSARKIQEFSAPWPTGALLVMHSDGLATQWNLAAYPGLTTHHPSLIAAILYRDFVRGRDDVTVAVARDFAGTH